MFIFHAVIIAPFVIMALYLLIFEKKDRAVLAMTLVFVCIILGIVALAYYGEKDPIVNVLENSVQIKGLHGLSINFTEITDITLIEKSMNNIGVRKRTFGYGAGALKGHFISSTDEQILLFVRPRTSPTIHIKRDNAQDVYISFRSDESTRNLYRELATAISAK
jgi:multisubunit Na+/H+ antiporter MnhC subunit